LLGAYVLGAVYPKIASIFKLPEIRVGTGDG
jgi:hypothetical protein